MKVDAETVYEVACLVLKAFERQRYLKGPGRRVTLQIETDPPVRFIAGAHGRPRARLALG